LVKAIERIEEKIESELELFIPRPDGEFSRDGLLDGPTGWFAPCSPPRLQA
jgi:hypothetical protein